VSELASLFILGDEVSTEDSSRLLAWCHEAGADEFSLSIVGVEDAGRARVLAIEHELAAFERDPAPREGLMDMEGEEWIRPVPLWSFTPASIRQLQKVLPDGVFSYGIWTEPAWCENLCLYRKSVLVLGIMTHEHLGIVRVTQSEREALEGLGIRFHTEMPFGS
jgi:hypothetical protein